MKGKRQKPKVKSTSKNSKVLLSLLPFCFLLLTFSGCAGVKQAARGFVGISTQEVEDSRKEAIVKIFDYDYNACYDEVTKTLQAIGAYIYARDGKKQMIALYVSETDTTAVGVFFKEIEKVKTQVEISSPSVYAKEFIAKQIAQVLEKKITLKELEVKVNVEKQEQDK